jgi:hypothetical protein
MRGVECITFDIFFRMYSIWCRKSDKFTGGYVIQVSSKDFTWESYKFDDNSTEININLWLSIWWIGSIVLFLSDLYLFMFKYFCHLNDLYMFIYFHAHIAKRAYIFLRIYTYKWLHITKAIYALYIATYFCARISTHAYIHLRPYTFTSLHTSTPTLIYLITYRITYSSYTCLHTSTPIYRTCLYTFTHT